MNLSSRFLNVFKVDLDQLQLTKRQGVTENKKGTTGREKRATGRPATLFMLSWGTGKVTVLMLHLRK